MAGQISGLSPEARGSQASVLETAHARPAFEMSFTLDHRYVYGWHVGRLAAALRDYFANPEAFD